MTDAPKQTSVDGTRVGYQIVLSTAKVGGVFSVIFLVLLAGNFIGSGVIGPAQENTLAEMKIQINAEPENEKLLADIRQSDLKIRRNRVWRLDFARNAGYALFGSVLVFLIFGKLARVLQQRPPQPGPAPEVGVQQIREARSARWTVMAGLVVVAAAGGLLVRMYGPLTFVEAKDAGPSYASMEKKSRQWHRFRGPGGSGVSAFTNIPDRWDGATGEGILWKTEVPLIGHNSPIVWEGRIFLSGATEEKRVIFCFDANSGQLLWQGDVPTVPAVAAAELDIMEDTGYSASTMATDGKRVYAIFVTGDIAAFDFNGRRLWHKNLGVPNSAYGYASSLDTYQDRVLIQYDQGDGSEGESRLYALDGSSGRLVWEAKREVPNSWTSPIVVEVAGQPQIITVADPWVAGYDPADGREIWRAECVSGDTAPSPIYAGGLVLAIEPYSQVVAVKPDGQGNVTETHIAWRMDNGGPDICCPVGNAEHVYLMESEGLLMCCNLADGSLVYEHDLRESFMASPSLVGDKLYLLTLKGVMHIAEAGREYKEVTKCDLGEECHASPAFADGRIYIRGVKHLYCIGKPSATNTLTD